MTDNVAVVASSNPESTASGDLEQLVSMDSRHGTGVTAEESRVDQNAISVAEFLDDARDAYEEWERW